MILGFKKTIGNKPTHFKEKILSGLGVEEYEEYAPKIHTIREDKNNRWNQDRIIHTCYGVRTKQFEKFVTMQCKGVQKIQIIYPTPENFISCQHIRVFVDDKEVYDLIQLVINDGFISLQDFCKWFKDDFEGKIIHWTDKRY